MPMTLAIAGPSSAPVAVGQQPLLALPAPLSEQSTNPDKPAAVGVAPNEPRPGGNLF